MVGWFGFRVPGSARPAPEPEAIVYEPETLPLTPTRHLRDDDAEAEEPRERERGGTGRRRSGGGGVGVPRPTGTSVGPSAPVGGVEGFGGGLMPDFDPREGE